MEGAVEGSGEYDHIVAMTPSASPWDDVMSIVLTPSVLATHYDFP